MTGIITVNDSIADSNVESQPIGIPNIANTAKVIPTRFMMNVDDQKIPLNYNIIGSNEILDIYPESYSLIIKMNATEQGFLLITLPRQVIDARIDDMDDSFYVLVNQEEIDFDEIATPANRTI